ncbi:MAG TPA: zinc-ribbon domain-containing protein [Candidatus Bathyarchaeia archaeon]|nr:zinc-ribbon domain-containing protein [Candidatus Bathyarchaeia archaeon]
MSELEPEIELEVEMDEPLDLTKNVDLQIRFGRFFGPSGRGKTLFMVGEIYAACIAYGANLIITNLKLFNPPKGVEVFQSGDIRVIMERMELAFERGEVFVVGIDELDKSVNSRASKSNFNLWVVRLAGDARKSGCRALYYSAQPRKGVDSLIRANDSFVILPRHLCDINDCPMAYLWRDPEAFENDFLRGEENYRDAITYASMFKLDFLRTGYDTKQKIILALDPTIPESDAPGLTKKFLDWCAEKKVELPGESSTNVMKFMSRWNSATFLIPYSKKGLDVIYTELLRLGALKFEAPETPEPKAVSNPQKTLLKCVKCGNEWRSRVATPKKCPQCQSAKWNDSLGEQK